MAARIQAVTLKPESARRVVGNEIVSSLDLVGAGHMGRMAEVRRDLLLIIASKRVEGVIVVILGGEEVDTHLPHLLDTGYPPSNRLLIKHSLHNKVDVCVAANTDICFFDQFHHLVSVSLVVRREGDTMAGRDTPLVAFSHGFHRQVLQVAAYR